MRKNGDGSDSGRKGIGRWPKSRGREWGLTPPVLRPNRRSPLCPSPPSGPGLPRPAPVPAQRKSYGSYLPFLFFPARKERASSSWQLC